MRLAARIRRIPVVALAVFLGACLTPPTIDMTGRYYGALDDAGAVSFRFQIATEFPANSFTGRYQAYSDGNLVYDTAIAGTIDGGNWVTFSVAAPDGPYDIVALGVDSTGDGFADLLVVTTYLIDGAPWSVTPFLLEKEGIPLEPGE